MRARRAWLVSMFLMAWPAGAQASSAVLLPLVGGDAAVSADARLRAQAIAREVLAGEGFMVLASDAVTAALPRELAACGPDDRCAFELRALLGADVAVGLALHGQGDDVRRVVVVWTGVRGVAHRVEAQLDPEAGLPFAVAEPLREAMLAWRAGRRTDPEPDAPIADRAEPSLRVEPSIANWFLGGLLVLGSVPLVGYGINTAVRDGECVVETAGGCTQRIRFEEGAGIFTGLGAAVLAAGIVMLVMHPIPVFVLVDRDSASLHAWGTF